MKDLWKYFLSGNALERLETVVSVALTIVVGLIAVMALVRLWITAVNILVDPEIMLDYESFRTLFAMVFTVLVALEFNNSIVQALTRRQTVVLAKGVILIGILTMVRKLLLLDVTDTSGAEMAGMALVIAALGMLYFVFARWPMNRAE